jgi:exopolysaccharide biosynthesis polyprenyl glycosylphosphotransferase
VISQGASPAAPLIATTREVPTAPELLSPCWPLRMSVSGILTLVLVGAVALPLVAGSPGGVELAAGLLPALFIAIASRGVFQLLAGGAAEHPLRIGAAAAGAGLAAAGSGAVLTLALGGSHGALVLLGAWAFASATFGVAAMMRRLELRLGALSRRIFFIGLESQLVDLAREVSRRGDLAMVGSAGLPAQALTEPARVALRDLIAEARPTTLVMSAEAARSDELVAVASGLHLHGLRVRLLNDFYERQFSKVPVTELSRSWFLFDVAEIHQSRLYGGVKRVLETTAAALLILLASPLLLGAIVAVRLSGAGPVFFRQERIGLHGRRIALTKFRTMTSGPHDPGWATQQPGLITTAGRFLRRYRLDELPQLWNVVKGDLSLVGPRPEQPALVERLADQIEFYPARHVVRPGLTGWAQVNHGYGGSVAATIEKLQYDFFYIRHQSLRLDLLILVATVRTILSGNGR